MTTVFAGVYTGQKATIHQTITMPATSENVLLQGYNHLTTSADDPSLIITVAGARAITKVSGHQYQWLAGG